MMTFEDAVRALCANINYSAEYYQEKPAKITVEMEFEEFQYIITMDIEHDLGTVERVDRASE